MSQQASPPVTVYADYVCPFCYLGYESFDQYRETRTEPLETTWHPFDLRSGQRRSDGTLDTTTETGKDEAYFEQARENVERLAEKYDVEMAQPLSREVDSYDAQRLAYQAATDHPEQFEQLHRDIFDALWEAGRDIGDRDILRDLATDAGLSAAFVEETLADETTAERLEAAFDAAHQQGITGVPTFVTDDHAARGAVPPEQLQRLVDGV